MAGYGDDSGFNDWLAEYGYTLPTGAPTPAVLRQRGSVYIDATYGPRFKGQVAGGYAQERQWPRTGAVVNGQLIPDSVVPQAVIDASYMAAWIEANSPGSLSSDSSSGQGAIKREKVDVIEVEYQDASKMSEGQVYDPFAPSSTTPINSEIDGLLKPYLDLSTSLSGIGIWSVGPDC